MELETGKFSGRQKTRNKSQDNGARTKPEETGETGKKLRKFAVRDQARGVHIKRPEESDRAGKDNGWQPAEQPLRQQSDRCSGRMKSPDEFFLNLKRLNIRNLMCSI